MVEQRHIDYIRSNSGKYSLDSLKQALLQAGLTADEVEEAVRLASEPPAAAPPAPPPPVTPGEPVETASAPAQQQSEPAAATPFSITKVIAQAKQVLTDPYGFFRAMPKNGGYKAPILFLLSMFTVSLVIMLVLKGILGSAPLGIAGMIAGLMVGLIMMAVVILISTAVAHLIWILLGSRESFETSFRCLAYFSALAPIHSIASSVPAVGQWLSIPVTLYGLYLYIPASVEAHGISKKKAVVVAAIFGLLTLISLVITAISANKMKQMMAEGAATAAGASTGDMEKLKEIAGNMQQAAASMERAAGEMDGTDQAEAGREQLMQMASAVGKSMKEAGNTELVDDRELEEMLPKELYGMTRGEPSRSTGGAAGIKAATAKVIFTAKRNRKITVKISDSGGLGGVMSMGWDLSDAGKTAERGITLTEYKGFKARERYSKSSNTRRLSILVGKRFIVEIKGNAGFSSKNLRSVADSVDLEKLQSLAR